MSRVATTESRDKGKLIILNPSWNEKLVLRTTQFYNFFKKSWKIFSIVADEGRVIMAKNILELF